MELNQAKELARKIFEDNYKIEVEVLDGGKLPVKAHASDAGFDVFCTEDIEIFPGQVIKHPLNIKMKLPVGCWARVETKSGLGSQGMLVFAGVVDRGYRGIPHVVATNLNCRDGKAIVIKKGMKIAQITLNAHSECYYMVQVDKVDENSDRKTSGFGSTGV